MRRRRRRSRQGSSASSGGGGVSKSSNSNTKRRTSRRKKSNSFGEENSNNDASSSEISAASASADVKLRNELLRKPCPDLKSVLKICQGPLMGIIPPSSRSDVWEAILLLGERQRRMRALASSGVSSSTSSPAMVPELDVLRLEQRIKETPLNLKRQRVVRLDAERTRPEHASLRTPEMQSLLVRLLTYFCRDKNIRYKQGLNEVLAPFVLLRTPRLSDAAIYALFERFVSRFVLHMYTDDDFVPLQCALRGFEILLIYHDAELASYLRKHGITPEMYATPWFLTHFARNVPLATLMFLWDALLLADDHLVDLHMYFAVAFVMNNRRAILRTHSSDLPILMTSMQGIEPCTPSSAPMGQLKGLESEAAAMSLLHSAKGLRESTPSEFVDRIRDLLYSADRAPTRADLLAMESMHCVSVGAEAVIRGIWSGPALLAPPKERMRFLSFGSEAEVHDGFVDVAGDDVDADASSAVNYIVLDCREIEEFEASHFNGNHVYHLDPDMVSTPQRLQVALDTFAFVYGIKPQKSAPNSHVELAKKGSSLSSADASELSMSRVPGGVRICIVGAHRKPLPPLPPPVEDPPQDADEPLGAAAVAELNNPGAELALKMIECGFDRVCVLGCEWKAVERLVGSIKLSETAIVHDSPCPPGRSFDDFVSVRKQQNDELEDSPSSENETSQVSGEGWEVVPKDAGELDEAVPPNCEEAKSELADAVTSVTTVEIDHVDLVKATTKDGEDERKTVSDDGGDAKDSGVKTPPNSKRSISLRSIFQGLSTGRSKEKEAHSEPPKTRAKSPSLNFMSRLGSLIKGKNAAANRLDAYSMKDASGYLTHPFLFHEGGARSWVILDEWLESCDQHGDPGETFEGGLWTMSMENNSLSDACSEDELLAVTKKHLIHLQRHHEDPSLVQILAVFNLEDLLRVTSRRSIKKLVIVEVKIPESENSEYEIGTGTGVVLKFFLEAPSKFIDTISKNFRLVRAAGSGDSV